MGGRVETEVQSLPAGFAERVRLTPRIHWQDDAGAHTVLLERRLVVGSATSADLCVADPLVSRVHAELAFRSDGPWVRDLGSRNGTHVGDVRVDAARLTDHLPLRVGATELFLSYETGESQRVELWPSDSYGRMVGSTPAMRELFAMLNRVAATDASVLVQGETGTGKELVAQAVHDHSPRAGRPFVVVDCAALPENLLDAELFGYAKGAFTGAVSARAGAFEAATGGTVFLDEIGELPLAMQPKLLRVLEAGTVRRLGETQHRHVDVRIVAATHRDLLEMVGRGEFREDLYFRLSVVPVRVPPLRERVADIPLLVRSFLGGDGLLDAALTGELRARAWRGNVRELRNFVQRVRALGSADAVALLRREASAYREGVSVAPPPPAAKLDEAPLPAAPLEAEDAAFELDYRAFREHWTERGERAYVLRLLSRHGRNVSAAARAAGVDRSYLHRLIRRHNLT